MFAWTMQEIKALVLLPEETAFSYINLTIILCSYYFYWIIQQDLHAGKSWNNTTTILFMNPLKGSIHLTHKTHQGILLVHNIHLNFKWNNKISKKGIVHLEIYFQQHNTSYILPPLYIYLKKGYRCTCTLFGLWLCFIKCCMNRKINPMSQSY